MRKLWRGFKRILLPPAGTPVWLRLLPFAILGVLTFGVFYGGVYAWSYTNSPEFCGSTCHTMPPEYSAYLRSPHARVQCVECHIGRDIFTTQFTRKAGDLRHVILTLTEEYEFPIFTRAMRPARDTCERCHFPEKFSDDSLREVHNFGSDPANTPQSTFLIMKTGGGVKREGLGRGIHWHIENQVWFLATDFLQQDIPYVRVVDDEGVVTEYYDIASDITPEDVAGSTLERMDCIACHNRVTHTIPSPPEAIDQALNKRLISRDLPEIREQTVALLSAQYPNEGKAFEAFNTLEDYYRENYPDLYIERREAIRRAIAIVQDIYSQIVFTEQKIDWTTHPDNLGHKEDPGCFRCHDGKHLTASEEAIRLECNLCHSVPIVADQGELVTNIEIARGPEPVSHTHTSWITLHGKAIDSSCAACHPPADSSLDLTELEGKPPVSDSFCGNEACHTTVWTYTGFDDPALDPVLERQLYKLRNTSPYLLEDVPRTFQATFQAMFEGRCGFCHMGEAPKAGLDVSTYQGVLDGGSSGPGIVPGDPEASIIIQRQTGSSEHFGQLLEDEVEALREWILTGAPEG